MPATLEDFTHPADKAALDKLKAVLDTDVPAFNKLVKDSDVPAIILR